MESKNQAAAPSTDQSNGFRKRVATIADSLNFFRVHLLLFVLVPLFLSLIFYWLNDARTSSQPFVSFTDSLFFCYSAATVAGLSPMVVSNLNVGQQIILALLSAAGSYSFSSVVMVLIRRYYFHKEMKKKLEQRVDEEMKARRESGQAMNEKPAPDATKTRQSSYSGATLVGQRRKNSGFVTLKKGPILFSDQIVPASEEPQPIEEPQTIRSRRTVTYDPNVQVRPIPRRANTMVTHKDRGYGGFPPIKVLLRSALSMLRKESQKIPLTRTISRKLEVPRTQTLLPAQSQPVRPGLKRDPTIKYVPYLSFDAVVGKNSSFQDLSEDEREEIGGLELRALNMLSWIVPAYWVITHLIGFVILAPYMARREFRNALTTEDGQAAPVNSTWFTLFQVISSYSNSGILVDASVVPFQKAYLLLWIMMYLILAGNTAFPIFLRFIIWIASVLVPKTSRAFATFRFILDHPRRCFLYLFPSAQTWYLICAILSLNGIDWALFLLLDIGDSPISSIPTGIRVMAGLFQSVAVRCGGFQIVSMSTVAPAVQVLYLVMMYIGALPLALGVRTTNVYEDRSIALFDEEIDDDSDFDMHVLPGATKAQAWGNYMTWHLKRQLSFDLWWLAVAVFSICALERGKLLDPQRSSYFNVFAILFEVVSAYGTVGLTLGIPNQNNAFSGSFGKASKLILCIVMLRGRHRGLPDAIDRSVLLPNELNRQSAMERQFRERQAAVRQTLETMHEVDELNTDDCPPGMA